MDEAVTQVILPAEDGLIGILTSRSPLLARLGLGELRIDLADGQITLRMRSAQSCGVCRGCW